MRLCAYNVCVHVVQLGIGFATYQLCLRRLQPVISLISDSFFARTQSELANYPASSATIITLHLVVYDMTSLFPSYISVSPAAAEMSQNQM